MSPLWSACVVQLCLSCNYCGCTGNWLQGPLVSLVGVLVGSSDFGWGRAMVPTEVACQVWWLVPAWKDICKVEYVESDRSAGECQGGISSASKVEWVSDLVPEASG